MSAEDLCGRRWWQVTVMTKETALQVRPSFRSVEQRRLGSYLVENAGATSECGRKSAAERTCSSEKSSIRTTCTGRVSSPSQGRASSSDGATQ